MATKTTAQDTRQAVDNVGSHGVPFFTLSQMKDLCLIPWARDDRTIRAILERDTRGENILEAVMVGAGRQKRYSVPTRGIIKYLTKYGPALMPTARKPKQYGNSTRRKKTNKTLADGV